MINPPSYYRYPMNEGMGFNPYYGAHMGHGGMPFMQNMHMMQQMHMQQPPFMNPMMGN